MRRLAVAIGVLALACGAALGLPLRAQAQGGSPFVLLVSFDGWRWDYDTRAPAPNVRRLAARGVRAAGLIPSYPSKTIPNHYTIATGLYPGHHGMIANVIRDPATGRVFDRGNRDETQDPMWWGGEPIWNTAQRQGRIAATMFWPGSEAPIGGSRPRYWREFDARVSAADRVDQVLAWLDRPPQERPSFITLYLDDVDTMGHWYGPDSVQVRDAIGQLDEQLGRLTRGLEQRGLLDAANIVLVSDHGMAATTKARTIVVDDLVELADVDIVDINPTLGVVPKPGREEAVTARLHGRHGHLTMYRPAETPAHWRFRDQPRVPPLTGVADEGWVVLRRSEVESYWKRSPNGGQHGYDPRIASMRGMFIAAGPAFRRGVTVPALENVHVYDVLARALGVTPARNDGDPAVADRLMR